MRLQSPMLLPPPYAVDIGDQSVKVAQLAPRRPWASGARWEFRVLGERELERGWVMDGIVRDRAAVAEVIRRIAHSAAPRFRWSPYAITTLPESRTFLTTIAAPAERTPQAIRRAAGAAVPIATERAVLTATPIPGATDRLAIAAAPAEVAESYASLLEEAGFVPIACTTEADALARAVAATHPAPATTIILDAGATRTGIAIAVGMTVVTSVTAPVSGNQLTAAIGQQLRIDDAAAEHAKRALDCAPAADGNPAAAAVLRALAPLATSLQQVRAFADAYLPAATRPSRIVLTGGGAALRGFDRFLDAHAGLPIERFDFPPALVTRREGDGDGPVMRLATAFGLGIIALDPVGALAEPLV